MLNELDDIIRERTVSFLYLFRVDKFIKKREV